MLAIPVHVLPLVVLIDGNVILLVDGVDKGRVVNLWYGVVSVVGMVVGVRGVWYGVVSALMVGVFLVVEVRIGVVLRDVRWVVGRGVEGRIVGVLVDTPQMATLPTIPTQITCHMLPHMYANVINRSFVSKPFQLIFVSYTIKLNLYFTEGVVNNYELGGEKGNHEYIYNLAFKWETTKLLQGRARVFLRGGGAVITDLVGATPSYTLPTLSEIYQVTPLPTRHKLNILYCYCFSNFTT